jgi:hypothetical protein
MCVHAQLRGDNLINLAKKIGPEGPMVVYFTR